LIHLQQIALVQTITKVEELIDIGKCDSGRLFDILKLLKKKREMMEKQIKVKNQKLKKEQQKLKN